MKDILIGFCIGVCFIVSVFVGTIAFHIPDYNKAECIYYASQVWCKK